MIIICKSQKIEEGQDQDQIGQDMDLNLEKSLKIGQDMENQDLAHLEAHMDQDQEKDQGHLEDHMGLMDQNQEIDHMEGLMDQMDQDQEIDQDHLEGHMGQMD